MVARQSAEAKVAAEDEEKKREHQRALRRGYRHTRPMSSLIHYTSITVNGCYAMML
jgi:hypothetical protein